MLSTYTIHLIVEEVSGETRYSAAVKDMPGCFVESLDLQLLFENLYDAISVGLAQKESKDNEQVDTQKEQKRNIFEADYPDLEDG